jgi:hypothetical protein
MSGIRVECRVCGKVYPLVDVFNCDHILDPENFIGHTLVDLAAQNFVMRLEGERIRENALKEIDFLEELYKAA